MLGVFSLMLAVFMHFQRVWHLKHNKPFHYFHTLVWAGFLGFITIVSVLLELYFATTDPYLDREVSVVVNAAATDGSG